MPSLYSGGIYGGQQSGGIYGSFGGSPSPTSVALSTLSPQQRAIVIQKLSGHALGGAAPVHHYSGIGGFLHGVGHVLGQGVDEIAHSLQQTPQSLLALAEAYGSDVGKNWSAVAHGNLLALPSAILNQTIPGMGELIPFAPGHQVRDIGVQMGHQVVTDLRHPLRHPGYTAMDLFNLASLGKGGFFKAGAISDSLRALRVPRPENPLGGEHVPVGPEPSPFDSGNVSAPSPVAAAEKQAAAAAAQRAAFGPAAEPQSGILAKSSGDFPTLNYEQQLLGHAAAQKGTWSPINPVFVKDAEGNWTSVERPVGRAVPTKGETFGRTQHPLERLRQVLNPDQPYIDLPGFEGDQIVGQTALDLNGPPQITPRIGAAPATEEGLLTPQEIQAWARAQMQRLRGPQFVKSQVLQSGDFAHELVHGLGHPQAGVRTGIEVVSQRPTIQAHPSARAIIAREVLSRPYSPKWAAAREAARQTLDAERHGVSVTNQSAAPLFTVIKDGRVIAKDITRPEEAGRIAREAYHSDQPGLMPRQPPIEGPFPPKPNFPGHLTRPRDVHIIRQEPSGFPKPVEPATVSSISEHPPLKIPRRVDFPHGKTGTATFERAQRAYRKQALAAVTEKSMEPAQLPKFIGTKEAQAPTVAPRATESLPPVEGDPFAEAKARYAAQGGVVKGAEQPVVEPAIPREATAPAAPATPITSGIASLEDKLNALDSPPRGNARVLKDLENELIKIEDHPVWENVDAEHGAVQDSIETYREIARQDYEPGPDGSEEFQADQQAAFEDVQATVEDLRTAIEDNTQGETSPTEPPAVAPPITPITPALPTTEKPLVFRASTEIPSKTPAKGPVTHLAMEDRGLAMTDPHYMGSNERAMSFADIPTQIAKQISTPLSESLAPHFEQAAAEGKSFIDRQTYLDTAQEHGITLQQANALFDDASRYTSGEKAGLTPPKLMSAGLSKTQAREIYTRIADDLRQEVTDAEQAGRAPSQKVFRSILENHLPPDQAEAVWNATRVVKGGADITAKDYLRAIYTGLTVKPYAKNTIITVKDVQTGKLLSSKTILRQMGIDKLDKNLDAQLAQLQEFYGGQGEAQMTLHGGPPEGKAGVPMSTAADQTQQLAQWMKAGKIQGAPPRNRLVGFIRNPKIEKLPESTLDRTGRYEVVKQDIHASQNPLVRSIQRVGLGLAQRFPDSNLTGLGRDLNAQIRFENEQVARLRQSIELTFKDQGIPTSEQELNGMYKRDGNGRSKTQYLIDLTDSMNQTAQIGLLFLKPSYWSANTIGQIMLTLADHTLNPLSVGRASLMHRSVFSEEMAARQGMTAAEWHQMASGNLSGSMQYTNSIAGSIMAPDAGLSRYGMRLIQKTHHTLSAASGKVLDNPYRDNAFFHEAWRQGYRTPESIAELLSGKNEQGLIEVSRNANKNIIDYARMSSLEKNVARRIIFFYPWLKAATLYGPHFFANHPGQALLLTNMGQPAAAKNLKEIGKVPSFLPGVFKVGERDVPQIGKMPQIINPTSETVLGVPAQTLQTGWELLHGGVTPGNSLAQNLTPVAGAVLAIITRKDLFTGQAIPPGHSAVRIATDQWRNLPGFQRLRQNLTRAEQIAAGQTNPSTDKILFPYTKGEAWGRFLGPGFADIARATGGFGGLIAGGEGPGGSYALNTAEARSRFFAEQKASASNKQEREILNTQDRMRRYTEAGQKTGVFTSAPPQLKQAFAQQSERLANRQAFATQFGVRNSQSIPPLVELGSDLDVLVRRGTMKEADAVSLLHQVQNLPDNQMRALIARLGKAYFGSQTISSYRALFARLGIKVP